MSRHPSSPHQAPIPYESRTNRYLRGREENRAFLQVARHVAEITNTPVVAVISLRLCDPTDERALRGIPAIGRGVTGAQPHTRPGHGLL